MPPVTTKARSLRTEYSLEIPSEWNGKRVQRTFEFEPILEESILSLVHEYKCGRSDAITWLMSVGANAYRAGVIPEREPSNSIRYPFKLKISKTDNQTLMNKTVPPEDTLKRFLEGF